MKLTGNMDCFSFMENNGRTIFYTTTLREEVGIIGNRGHVTSLGWRKIKISSRYLKIIQGNRFIHKEEI